MISPADTPSLHLASASPRRREILAALGLRFSYAGTDVDEASVLRESASDMVVRLARVKARAARNSQRGDVIVAADTAVVIDDRILGKPASREDALGMLAALSGRSHEVYTGVVIVDGGEEQYAVSRSVVCFRNIDPAEAATYWASGEPYDKAGGYAIQGLAAIFVSELHGSFSGVMGLPVYETAAMLGNAGIDVLAQHTRGATLD